MAHIITISTKQNSRLRSDSQAAKVEAMTLILSSLYNFPAAPFLTVRAVY